jgi:hypothetical protein
MAPVIAATTGRRELTPPRVRVSASKRDASMIPLLVGRRWHHGNAEAVGQIGHEL